MQRIINLLNKNQKMLILIISYTIYIINNKFLILFSNKVNEIIFW